MEFWAENDCIFYRKLWMNLISRWKKRVNDETEMRNKAGKNHLWSICVCSTRRKQWETIKKRMKKYEKKYEKLKNEMNIMEDTVWFFRLAFVTISIFNLSLNQILINFRFDTRRSGSIYSNCFWQFRLLARFCVCSILRIVI